MIACDFSISFKFYLNSSCGLPGHKACNSVGPHTDTSPVYAPDSSLAGVARYKDRFYSHTQFYKDAASGALPSFTWLNCAAEAADHPCSDMAKGERCQKDIYESLRAGKGWNSTMFLIVYDDAGGAYDHMIPPWEGVPADEAPCRAQCADFDFRRLGPRTTALLMSPLVAKGRVVQEPQAGPTNTSQFEHSSVPATIHALFNTTASLTKRDAWAGSLSELLLDAPRGDTPLHLPTAPKPASPWGPPWVPPAELGGNTTHDSKGAPRPHHCPSTATVCPGVLVVTPKQRKTIRLYSRLTMTPEPDVDALNFDDAERWLGARWHDWLGQGGPLKSDDDQSRLPPTKLGDEETEAQTLSILDFGGSPVHKTSAGNVSRQNNQQAIAKAIAACAAAGGCSLTFPAVDNTLLDPEPWPYDAGPAITTTYMTSAFNLTSNLRLIIPSGVVLKVSTHEQPFLVMYGSTLTIALTIAGH